MVVTRQLIDDIFTDIETVTGAPDGLLGHKTDGVDPHAAAGYLQSGDVVGVFLPLTGGVMASAAQIKVDTNPIALDDLSRKGYVDDSVAAVDPTGVYLLLAGGTMAGAINMDGFAINNVLDGVLASDVAALGQVTQVQTNLQTHIDDATDPHAAAGYLTETDADLIYLPLDGQVAMQGEINMGSNKITSLAAGTAGPHAVNRDQMDAAIAAALTAYDTAAVSDAKNDGKMESYYTKNDDARAVAGRRIYIQSADPGAIANDDIWHDVDERTGQRYAVRSMLVRIPTENLLP